MEKTKQLQIRPYARLLTMLGEQLIKNERIALIELIKNSYDADAKWVKVSFKNFGENYEILDDSKIVIRDDGCGMNSEILENHFLNPATPEKKRRKKLKDTTNSGRIIQGEKGIGRFAMLKLGREIKIITRAKEDPLEYVLNYDFSIYDDEFLTKNGKEENLFLEDIDVSLTSRDPVLFVRKTVEIGSKKISTHAFGTRIEISNLKGSWSEIKVENVYRDIARLQSIFDFDTNGKIGNNDFEVVIYKDKKRQSFEERFLEKLHFLLEERSVVSVENGCFDGERRISFNINGSPFEIDIFNPYFTSLHPFRKNYNNGAKTLKERKVECGKFSFVFYIFDLSNKAPSKYLLDSKDKELLKSHRIYLYRDGIRVYPYGDPSDDWLGIDIMRGTISAGKFFSNDQVVGYVKITQKENPKLQDKTNREGLIEEGNSTQDFIVIIQNILSYLREKPYKRYKINLDKKKSLDIYKFSPVQKTFDNLKEIVGENKKAKDLLLKAEKEYNSEKNFLTRRAETTEDLAGVGLSVETASHDIMAIMSKVLINIDGLIKDLMSKDEVNVEELLKELRAIRGGTSFIEAQLKDIQLLFRSSKQRRKNIRIKEIVEKVERIYKRLLNKESIKLLINTVGSPLIAKTTDAVLLQLLLNLFDNSVYWLQQVSNKDKKIEILLDGNKGTMIFSDNGPGIHKDDEAYIFEPFYSGKGEEGRGLGLYIARQLLERNNYFIDLAKIKSEKILSGANFVVSFVEEEK